MARYRKLVKHKRSPNKERSAFSSNSSKTVYTYGDGSSVKQSHLSGKYQKYNKKGKPVGKPYGK